MNVPFHHIAIADTSLGHILELLGFDNYHKIVVCEVHGLIPKSTYQVSPHLLPTDFPNSFS